MSSVSRSTSCATRLSAGLSALLLLAAFGPASLAGAQATGQSTVDPAPAPALAALGECSALAERRSVPEAARVGRLAESQLRAAIARDPRNVEAIVGLARAISQCILPAADVMGQGELSAQSIELLHTALELAPRHWTARFVLANIYFRSPPFLGREPLAARELDELLRQQGDRTDQPTYARTFELRGRLLRRAKQEDSARVVWTRGSALFPADTMLRALAAPASGAAPRAPGTASLGAVEVRASSSAPPASAPSVQEVSRSAVVMTAGGTADVLQAVQMLPGATHVGEGADVYTRGGGASETALLVDGARTLSLSRFEGLGGGMFGALEPFVVKSVRYSSGGFSVKHGNALSGVLEIDTDGRPRERQLRAGLSMSQGSATVRAPVTSKVGAWATARLSNTAMLLAVHGRGAEFDGAPHSEEMAASVVATPSPTSEVRATVLAERDDSRRVVSAGGWDGAFHSRGAVRAALLSSRWMPGAGAVVVRTNVAASSRANEWDFGVLARDRREGSLVARADAEWGATSSLTLRGGVEHGRYSRVELGTLPTTGLVAPGSPTRSLASGSDATAHRGAYAEAEATHGGAALLVGVRADRLPGESVTSFDPRVSVSSRRGAWTARLSGGSFHQGRWQSAPAIPDGGAPSGTPRTARHLVAGVEHEGATTMRIEAFDKRYADYAALGAGPRIERARARGVDLLARRAIGARVTGWAGYSLLDAAVRLADGRIARSPYDVTHSLTLSATAALSADWSLGTTARYGTGAPVTPVVGATTTADGRAAPLYGAVTSDRLPNYARLDARLMRFVRTPAFLLTTFVEVLNVAGRRNVSGMTYDASYRTPIPTHAFFAQRMVVAGGEVQLR